MLLVNTNRKSHMDNPTAAASHLTLSELERLQSRPVIFWKDSYVVNEAR